MYPEYIKNSKNSVIRKQKLSLNIPDNTKWW